MSLEPEEIECEFDGEADEVNIEEIVKQTPGAVLFKIAKEDVWIPKSLISYVEKDCVWVASWFVKKEGL